MCDIQLVKMSLTVKRDSDSCIFVLDISKILANLNGEREVEFAETVPLRKSWNPWQPVAARPKQ